MADRPLLVVIASGVGRVYREYLLRSMSTRYRLHLLVGAEPGWEQQYIAGWTVLGNLQETVDAGELTAAAQKLADAEPVHGVFSWDEARVLQCAKVAAALDLPGSSSVEAVMRCRDKHLTRSALAAAGVPQPASALAGSVDEARSAAERIGYPVVLKPRAMAASLGVVRVDSPQELTDRLGYARDTTLPGAWQYDSVLVEEYLPDPEVSVDSAVHRGEVLPMFVARKEIGYPPYFEEVGHVVDAADPLLADPQVRSVLREVHAALGFTDGMTHTELKLTPAGPKVIEVNARLGGDLIPYLGMLASGTDPGLAAAAVACGQRPELAGDRRRAAAVRFFYPDREGTTIGEIGFDRAALPEPVDLAEPLVQPGAVVSPPPEGTLFGRIALATAVADSPRQCQEALAAAGSALSVRPVAAAG